MLTISLGRKPRNTVLLHGRDLENVGLLEVHLSGSRVMRRANFLDHPQYQAEDAVLARCIGRGERTLVLSVGAKADDDFASLAMTGRWMSTRLGYRCR